VIKGYLRWLLALAIIGAAVWLIPDPGGQAPLPGRISASSPTSPALESPMRKIDLVLYVPDKNRAGLEKTETWIETGGDVSKQVEEALKKLFEAPMGLFPEDTVIREVFVYNDVAVVSLDGGFENKFRGGPWTELLALYSLVDTATSNFDGINKVKILIDDKEAEALVSHVDISGEIEPDFSFVLPPKDAGDKAGKEAAKE